jgi:hypothetical protein
MKVELICFLYNKKMADLDVKMPDIEAKIMIDTNDIESVRERGSDEEHELCNKTCMISTRSGDSFQIGKTYKEMIELWQSDKYQIKK